MKNIFIAPLSITLFLLLSLTPVSADIELPAIISSNMVLQRNTTVEFWGWADANEVMTIKVSWLNKKIKLKADLKGNWRTEIKTTNSTEPQSIEIKSKTSDITLNNVLFGEVWLCSGQSNMQQPMNGYTGQPTFGTTMAVAKSNNPLLRLFTVDRIGSKTPLKEVRKFSAWQQANPDNVGDFSAVAYFFGQQLQEILDVPVGLIHTSWGGSPVQAWMSKEILNNYEDINISNIDIEKEPNKIPTVLFNAMINPLIPYTIKGALWYQGEANRDEPQKYKELFPAMVKDWRNRWGIGDFPFYYVQIAPFLYGNNDAFDSVDNSAFIREVQLQSLDSIPNSGIAITMDIGAEFFIHPPNKKVVADRLLLNALNQTYGFNKVAYASPVYKSQETKNGAIILKFKNAESGLYAPGELEGFEIAGEDKIFYPATAEIINRKHLSVKNEEVKNPVAVRYAWKNWVEGTLFNTHLLPASSFRTDKWNDAKRYKKETE